jgi:hypothetical protein
MVAKKDDNVGTAEIEITKATNSTTDMVAS